MPLFTYYKIVDRFLIAKDSSKDVDLNLNISYSILGDHGSWILGNKY